MQAVVVGLKKSSGAHLQTHTHRVRFHEAGVVFMNKKPGYFYNQSPLCVCVPWHIDEGELVHQNTAQARGECSALRFITTSSYTDTPKP